MSSNKKPKVEESTDKKPTDVATTFNKNTVDTNITEDKQSLKRKNFVKACEQVSLKSFLDYYERFKYTAVLDCTKHQCIHQEQNCDTVIKQLPDAVEKLFEIEVQSQTWNDLLSLCLLNINPTQYLSDKNLQNIVEIILNAHDDDSELPSILKKCQKVLSLSFNMHPPCTMKSIRKCYINFLTSPMDLKESTFTNRSQFESNKGIVKYCLTRLEAELSPESKDGKLFNKDENLPEELKNTVQGYHWEKQKFDIYEMLDRPQRIYRLMTVLESLIELFQIDLAIWHSRYTNNMGSHIMRSHRPLMAYIMWSQNVLYTGAVTQNTRQIMRLFVNFVYLEYSVWHIRIITMWLNTMIETFYMFETKSNADYPNIGKYCCAFAKEFYKIILEKPSTSFIRILEKIEPKLMKYLISIHHLNTILPGTNEDDIINIFINFIENEEWNKFPIREKIIASPKPLKTKHVKPNRLLDHLARKCQKAIESVNVAAHRNMYPKLSLHESENDVIDRNDVINLIYMSLDAYLHVYRISEIQFRWNALNDDLDRGIYSFNVSEDRSTYSVSESFLKKYRSIFQRLKDLMLILHNLKTNKTFPEILMIFKSIDLLSL
ncbi:unnamed protein product [Leptosia nina]|uniref:Uncharacterized protein n=1 Tax=Leptosia nina TaxID=320188 RepID=A0AAV1K070_9NEOP